MVDNFFVVGIDNDEPVLVEDYTELIPIARANSIDDFFFLSHEGRVELFCLSKSNENAVIEAFVHLFKNTLWDNSKVSVRKGINAIEYLYYVSNGIHSKILGDYEILGLIRANVKRAKSAGLIGVFMERLLNSVFQASKAVKTHTELSGGTISISFAVVMFIKVYCKNILDAKITIIGTGEEARVTYRNCVDYLGTTEICLVGDDIENIDFNIVPFNLLVEKLLSANVIIIADGVSQEVNSIIVDYVPNLNNKVVANLSASEHLSSAVILNKNIIYADIKSLSKLPEETYAKRKAEIPKATAIINEHLEDFMEWCQMRNNVRILKEIKMKLRSIGYGTDLDQLGISSTTLQKMEREVPLKRPDVQKAVIETFEKQHSTFNPYSE